MELKALFLLAIFGVVSGSFAGATVWLTWQENHTQRYAALGTLAGCAAIGVVLVGILPEGPHKLRYMSAYACSSLLASSGGYFGAKLGRQLGKAPAVIVSAVLAALLMVSAMYLWPM